jgi:hypothetical protein
MALRNFGSASERCSEQPRSNARGRFDFCKVRERAQLCVAEGRQRVRFGYSVSDGIRDSIASIRVRFGLLRR